MQKRTLFMAAIMLMLLVAIMTNALARDIGQTSARMPAGNALAPAASGQERLPRCHCRRHPMDAVTLPAT